MRLSPSQLAKNIQTAAEEEKQRRKENANAAKDREVMRHVSL